MEGAFRLFLTVGGVMSGQHGGRPSGTDVVERPVVERPDGMHPVVERPGGERRRVTRIEAGSTSCRGMCV
ncbi:hypothetical protein [Arthrobacter humicola]|uniref:hypothetical protein n=1 Tax=Arthrobacter humicola TaxID=409291 RepID=UPI001FAE0121|nr:hypothetical protein [Arthrobacter humicola]MCI9870551.1 hypothetical protein [Arthrobacter humicola]